MLLITSDSDLRLFIPNIQRTVEGETPFFDRIRHHVLTAQEHVARRYAGPWLDAAARAEPGTDELREILRPLVAVRAFRTAIPELDLQLTPNGFAVVSNSNVAPASAARTEALTRSLLRQEDDLTMRLIETLRAMPAWRETKQAQKFRTTLFILPGDIEGIPAQNTSARSHTGEAGLSQGESTWDRLEALRPRLASAEEQLAEISISPELLHALRAERLAGQLEGTVRGTVAMLFMSAVRMHVIATSTLAADGAAAVAIMQRTNAEHRYIEQAVQEIRRDRTNFPEWRTSRTAHLFDPPKFINKKSSSAYFF